MNPQVAPPLAPPSASSRRVAAFVRRIPATLSMAALVLVVGIASEGLWSPLSDSVAGVVAYGLPAFEEGRFWTAFTGTFFVATPGLYVVTMSSFLGMAYLEFRRGTTVALSYYWVGQLFAVFGAAAATWLLALTGSPWAQALSGVTDVGPSGGTVACIAAAIALLRAPWRLRGLLILLSFLTVALLFWGALADLEHWLAAAAVLAVDRSIRPQRTTVREQRLIAFVALLSLGAVNLLFTIVGTDGPFGVTEPEATSFLSLGVNVFVILLIANGLRRARRWAWWIAIILSVLNVFVATVALLLGLDESPEEVVETLGGSLAVNLATGALWLMLLVYLILVRGAFRWRRAPTLGISPVPDTDEVRSVIEASGGGTLSWMQTWDRMLYARTSTGIVAYRRHAGVAIALADPIGPESGRAQSVSEFIAIAERAGLVPCFFSAQESTRAAAPPTWQSLVVADDTIVDLPGLEFTGKRWGQVRTAVNRAVREGVEFRMTHLSAEPWGVQAQLRGISEMWVGDQGLPEMGFTLGTLDEAQDPQVRLALAVAANGDVDGFLSWLPVYGEGRIRGWTLDLMRRRDGAFGPVMEFLLGSSAMHFRDEGAEVMSLSGAPLAHEYPPDAGIIATLSDQLSESLEPVYGFQSLHRFKAKFHPRYETLFLLFRDEADLPRVGAALTRAFLPDATLRQFAGAGLELVRGKD